VEVDLASKDIEGIPKKSRQLANSMLAIFEVAMLERTKLKQRAQFRQMLQDFLRTW
jgi:hypothetical protein